MGNDAGYKRGTFKKVDTAKMTMDDAFAYIEFLLEEQKIIDRLRKERKAKKSK